MLSHMKSFVLSIVFLLFTGIAFAQDAQPPAEEEADNGPSLVSKIADSMWGWGPVIATRPDADGDGEEEKDMIPILVILLLGDGDYPHSPDGGCSVSEIPLCRGPAHGGSFAKGWFR